MRHRSSPMIVDRTRTVLAIALPRGALILSALTFAGYLMGLVRDRIFAHAFGPDLSWTPTTLRSSCPSSPSMSSLPAA